MNKDSLAEENISEMYLVSLANGQLYFHSQWEDYIYRNESMEWMTFYDFVMDTYEKSGGGSTGSGMQYLAQHPKYGVYGCVIRKKGHNTIAYFKGGYVPDVKDETKAEWSVMAVFSPT